MKEFIAKLIAKDTKLKKEDIEKLIEIPPSPELGDFAFPCFILAAKFKKNPVQIAQELAKKIHSNNLEKVESKGPYINFFINKNLFAEQVLEIDENFGKQKNKGKIMVEFPSPNTNKPLHLGHLRNMSIGESVSRILEFSGSKIIRANLYNDRGVHICKSMLAYKKWGGKKTPEKEKVKSDHLVGDFYVLFNKKLKENPKLDEEAQEMLRKWESGDKETIELWKKMNSWALSGFKETFKLIGLNFDKEYYESRIYRKAKEIVDLGIKKKVFRRKDDGAVIINLESENLGEKVILRADGTSIYITQDLYLAKLKDDEFNLDGSIYVVGNEQNYHFQVLFNILKRLEFKSASKLHHLSYGMVNLPEGRMKSREGNVVDADDLIEKMRDLAKHELKKRYKLNKKEMDSRALKIALASIKYMLLKIDIEKDMIFNPEEAISFEGDTGPYLQYTYARASSILKKSKTHKEKLKIPELSESEIKLIKELLNFKDISEQAEKNLSPHLIANYSFHLAQAFNEFYHSSKVIGSENEAFRLELIKKFRIVMSNSLNLLGIDVLEEM